MKIFLISSKYKNYKLLEAYICYFTLNGQQGAIFIAPEKEEQFFEEQDLGLAKTDKEVNSVSLAVNGDDGLRNEGDFASPRYFFLILISMFCISLPCIYGKLAKQLCKFL